MGYPGPAAARQPASPANEEQQALVDALREEQEGQDRKSTRLNSSH